ncbi:LysR substrate-binding domain-containing protein [Pseudomonas aeruginosa]|uniref:LysR substrate-binding domain-containing protein n=1 Tax=Pseudomonas aeruginosa TaxID=287 RepID=UPI0023496185|nr:substrate-binding domain-containing protein [Pseudomonas aeruginosa]MDG4084202.1 substrate-binding domain-containing protein [Pseudomonas aeruginosa]
MPTTSQPNPTISLAVTEGVWREPLAQLLALQRVEEPEVSLRISETAMDDLEQGLRHGRYHIAIALDRGGAGLPADRSDRLWQEEVVLAVPPGSPLLEHSEVAVELLHTCKMLPWTPCASHAVCTELRVKIEDAANWWPECSFELMATLVAANYGVGIAPRSRVALVSDWDIGLRPIAAGPHLLVTRLLRAPHQDLTAVERFAERAQRIAKDHSFHAAIARLGSGRPE